MADENVEHGNRDFQAGDPSEGEQPKNKETAREHPIKEARGGTEEPELVPQGDDDSQQS